MSEAIEGERIMANKTCMQRIDEDLIPVIRKYSTGSISDGIRQMEQLIQMSKIVKKLEDVKKK